MASTASSAIPLPAEAAPHDTGKPGLTFSPSTKFSGGADRQPALDSDECVSDSDDIQPDAMRNRDQARDAIRKEQVHMEGFLYKKAGGASKTWNKRWCVLRSQALLIYKHSSEDKLKRIIRADEIVDVRHVSRRNHEFVFDIETPERTFYFEASSEQELVTWTARVRDVVAAVNASSDAASNRRSSESRHAPRTMAQDVFSSLPAAPRAHDTTLAHAIFANDHAVSAGQEMHAATERLPRTDPTALGLRIETNTVQSAANNEGATALPLDIDVGHDHACDVDDDDEPNFAEDQRREIERRLDEDRIILRGYLLKQDKLRQWRRRWFVLRQNTLSYYADDKEYEVKQILRHHDIYDIRAPDPSTAKARSLSRTYFKLVAAKRNYWLAHDDAQVAREWFNALRAWNDAGSGSASLSMSAPARTGLVGAPRVYSPATEPPYLSHVGRQPSSSALKPTR
ncbi:hypothetical protein LPJ77_004280 [Coemansia sp. RSA 2523]|nr:hypothetical protein LPJ58_003576 [Coemansia sp. RSA 1591]KAJ1774937.1 hypothetical protein LPJ54_003997 [Coemansia sp. RSA 1824]KAJ1786978.1 hypothetical protein LPJ62_003571 [Coemansia sp. RSA 2167]KAJ1805344.1 hypothetical protein LPJ77_004280 [Coemansia sp. RSA 2523]KAJ2137696.1 hypothetical protein GGH17_001452 [Coemansia sp. RSA 788]KAJ2147514.1 hypothetical protein IW142_001581 [Coemansia sp. RSA 564]KAJ2168520.1 hypothetical protein GGH15_001313 [Coemansia sp. RSA 562]KAJ2293671.1